MQINSCVNSEQLRGVEGEAASVYFSVFDDLILQQKENFYFNTRNKRPPIDNVNAMLSFAYTLLANTCAAALETVGLDPYVGFLHKDRPGRVSLALDFVITSYSIHYTKLYEKIICVSTQLIEAGVDISFDTVIRCLCGLDSIAQATGRANRHGESDVKKSYIINLKDENISKLPEIKLGATHCIEVLDEFRRKPGKFGNELLSTIAIKRYFNLYYNDIEIKKHMDYKIESESESIYEMLELKTNRNTYYFEKENKQFPLSINYRFKTASKHFKVIDDNTKSYNFV